MTEVFFFLDDSNNSLSIQLKELEPMRIYQNVAKCRTMGRRVTMVRISTARNLKKPQLD